MQLPTIHLGGTPRRMLVEQLVDVVGALTNAQRLLVYAAPNGRDYPGSPEPGGQRTLGLMIATDEHQVRVRRLTSLIDELNALAQAIDSLE